MMVIFSLYAAVEERLLGRIMGMVLLSMFFDLHSVTVRRCKMKGWQILCVHVDMFYLGYFVFHMCLLVVIHHHHIQCLYPVQIVKFFYAKL